MTIYRIFTLIITITTLGLVFFWTPLIKNLGLSTRILYLHVPAAFLSIVTFILSGIYAYKYIKSNNLNQAKKFDLFTRIGIILLTITLLSGAVWSKISWGSFWNWDPRQISILILLIIYAAYFTLRSTLKATAKKNKLSAIYLIYASVSAPFLFFIIPGLVDSLHPPSILNISKTTDLNYKIAFTLIMSIISFSLFIYDIFLLKYKKLKINSNHEK